VRAPLTAPGSIFHLPGRTHALVWGALLVLILTLAGIARTYDGQRIWADWRESGNLRRSNYAEKVYFDHVLRTRANTWSNFAYVAVGFYGLAFGWRDLRRPRAAPAGYLCACPESSRWRFG